MSNDLQEPEDYRIDIIKGISQNLNSSEIASKLGVNSWIIKKQIQRMKYDNDKDLIQAYSEQENHLMNNKHLPTKIREEKFQNMTGMTIKEKNFENMVSFYKSELEKIIHSDDELAAISNLDKSVQRALKNSEIILGTKGKRRISPETRRCLFRI